MVDCDKYSGSLTTNASNQSSRKRLVVSLKNQACCRPCYPFSRDPILKSELYVNISGSLYSLCGLNNKNKLLTIGRYYPILRGETQQYSFQATDVHTTSILSLKCFEYIFLRTVLYRIQQARFRQSRSQRIFGSNSEGYRGSWAWPVLVGLLFSNETLRVRIYLRMGGNLQGVLAGGYIQVMVRINKFINKAVRFLLYQYSGIKIPPVMHSHLDNCTPPSTPAQPPPNHPQPAAHCPALPEAPILQPVVEKEVQNLSALACFSLDNMILHFERDRQSQYYRLPEPDSNEFYKEESSFLPLPFMNNYSHPHLAKNNRWEGEQEGGQVGGGGSGRRGRGGGRRGEEAGEGGSSYLSWSSLEQEFQSGSEGVKDEKSPAVGGRGGRGLPCFSKNVTKNLGKLLFKFIWKNRHHLPRMTRLPVEECEAVVGQVKQWKKENNITREYLLSKWHSSDPTAKVFRMLSHHFFRRRCLAALFRSRIALKRTHMDRIRKFCEAVSNPNALNSLN